MVSISKINSFVEEWLRYARVVRFYNNKLIYLEYDKWSARNNIMNID